VRGNERTEENLRKKGGKRGGRERESTSGGTINGRGGLRRANARNGRKSKGKMTGEGERKSEGAVVKWGGGESGRREGPGGEGGRCYPGMGKNEGSKVGQFRGFGRGNKGQCEGGL